MLRLLVHSAPRVKSFVRESYGSADFDVVAESEAGAPRQLADVCCVVVNAAFKSTCGVGVASKFTLPMSRRSLEVELRRERHVRVQIRLAVLDRVLRRIVEHERTRRGRERRLGVDAVELRDLVPQAGDREAAGALVVGDVSLIAPADVVGCGAEQPVARRIVARIARIGEEHAVPDVLVALESRRVAVDAAEPAAELELVATSVRTGCARRSALAAGRRRWAGVCDAAACARPPARRLGAYGSCRHGCARSAGARPASRRDEAARAAHVCLRATACRTGPDGWFEPWMFEWQFTHDRPNIRLLLFTVMASLS